MLLTTRQLIEMSGRSKGFVYKRLKEEGIEISDFYDDSVLRYFKKDVPDGLLTLGQMAEMSGLSADAVRVRLVREHIKIAFRNGNERFYDASALEAITRKRKALTDEERRERDRESKKRYKAAHKEQAALYSKEYFKAHREKINARNLANKRRQAEFERAKGGYYFVSVADFLGRWVIKACSLSYLDARMISEELNALGIRAHFKSHTRA